jgi:hypothetical protein
MEAAAGPSRNVITAATAGVPAALGEGAAEKPM